MIIGFNITVFIIINKCNFGVHKRPEKHVKNLTDLKLFNGSALSNLIIILFMYLFTSFYFTFFRKYYLKRWMDESRTIQLL